MEKQIIESSFYAVPVILFATFYFINKRKGGKPKGPKGSKVLDPFIEKILNKIKLNEMGLA